MTLLERIAARAERIRDLRDNHGCPGPRTVEDLRDDCRVQLRNTIPDNPKAEDLELAAALILLVAEDLEAEEPGAASGDLVVSATVSRGLLDAPGIEDVVVNDVRSQLASAKAAA